MSCEYIMNNAYFVGIIQYKFTLKISQDTIWIDFQHSTLPDSRKSTFPYVFCLVSVWEGFGKWPPPPNPTLFRGLNCRHMVPFGSATLNPPSSPMVSVNSMKPCNSIHAWILSTPVVSRWWKLQIFFFFSPRILGVLMNFTHFDELFFFQMGTTQRGLRAMEEKKHAVYEAVNKQLSLVCEWVWGGERWNGKENPPKQV